MPEDIESLLETRGHMDAYRARPPYQRNDYLIRIVEAAQEATREKRIEQMLSELETGDVYMKMPWHSVKVDSER